MDAARVRLAADRARDHPAAAGDLPGAEEAFLEAHEHGWSPQPGLALLRLAQGDVATAAALVADALDDPVAVPSKEWPPYGAAAPCAAAGRAGRDRARRRRRRLARSAAAELSEIAGTYRSPALEASAALARGRAALAAGDAARAAAECELALAGWQEVGAPYETAVVRLTLAAAQRALGRAVRADLEERAAAATLERIGARIPAPATAPRPAPARRGGPRSSAWPATSAR